MDPKAETPRRVSEQRILASARQRFESFGYRRTSVAEIAREAGIAVGTVYRYFKSKEDVFLAVVKDMNDAWLVLARDVLRQPGTPTERLARLGAVSVKFNQESKLLTSILNRDTEFVHAPLLDPIARNLVDQNVALMAEVLREGVEEGSLRAVDPERTAFVLFIGGQALFNQDHRPYEEVLPLYVDVLVRGLLPR